MQDWPAQVPELEILISGLSSGPSLLKPLDKALGQSTVPALSRLRQETALLGFELQSQGPGSLVTVFTQSAENMDRKRGQKACSSGSDSGPGPPRDAHCIQHVAAPTGPHLLRVSREACVPSSACPRVAVRFSRKSEREGFCWFCSCHAVCLLSGGSK